MFGAKSLGAFSYTCLRTTYRRIYSAEALCLGPEVKNPRVFPRGLRQKRREVFVIVGIK